MNSEVNFLNIGFRGYKMLIQLGGSGIKILFSKWFGHLEQVLSKDSSAAMSRIKRLSPGVRLPTFAQGALDAWEQSQTAVHWKGLIQQTAIREYFGLSEHQRVTILFYKSATETSPESECLNVFFTENQSRALFKDYQKRKE